jgi:beta-galactosidase
VELFLNDNSLGRIPPGELLDFVWKVPYRPGKLKAVGYRDNKPVAEKVFYTASNPAKIKLTTDNQNIKPDRLDISHLTTTIEDSAGNFVPWANNRIDYKIDGPVKLLGFDNGDPVDVTSHKETYRKTFNGLSLGIFQGTDNDAPIEVTAAGILGRTLFPKSTKIAIAINRIALRGKLSSADFDITYSINDSKPYKYIGAFKLTESATIKATITKNNKPFMTIQSDFTKGPLPKITDPQLVTKPDEPQIFDGPMDKQLAGQWILKAVKRGRGQVKEVEDRLFQFDPTGSVYTMDGAEKTLYGYWWYDYPDDVSQDRNDTGKGKLFMYVTDQMCSMKLESQKAEKLVIASRFSTWFFNRKK